MLIRTNATRHHPVEGHLAALVGEVRENQPARSCPRSVQQVLCWGTLPTWRDACLMSGVRSRADIDCARSTSARSSDSRHLNPLIVRDWPEVSKMRAVAPKVRRAFVSFPSAKAYRDAGVH